MSSVQPLRKTTAGIYTHAGPEISSLPKAFTSQLAVLSLLRSRLGVAVRFRLLPAKTSLGISGRFPIKIQWIFGRRMLSRAWRSFAARTFFISGRRYSALVAFEGALKIKEIAYVHAEALSGRRNETRSLALIEEAFPCIFICTARQCYENREQMQEGKREREKSLL